MVNRVHGMDSTCSAASARERRLAELLESYLAHLENGASGGSEAFLAAHPEFADELREHLDGLQWVHAAAARMRDVQAPPGTAPGAGQIGEFRLIREIGRGGMGIVYEAHQPSLNRQVALKVLPFGAVLDQRQIARFRNEAQAAAQLHHPHIVPVFAVGQEQGVYFYAMQYIDGRSLEQVIAEMRDARAKGAAGGTPIAGVASSDSPTKKVCHGQLSTSPPNGVLAGDAYFRGVARLGQEAAEALQHAHDYGIIHRDIKPSNLLIDTLGQLWITDFGLARMQSDAGVTMTGDVIGTLRYMSPEQAAGKTALVDARADVYSLGATLYELLTGQPAFGDEDRQRLLHRVVNEDPTPPRKLNRAIPTDLENIVLAAMASAREDRYATAQALADDLGRFLDDEPTLARRPRISDRAAKWARRHRPLVTVMVAALAAISLVSAVGAGLLLREQSRTAVALAAAEQSAEKSQESFARAERHFHDARDVVDQFGVGLVDRLAEIPGAERVRRDLLLESLRYYRQFSAEAAHDPGLRRELAVAHFKSGVIAARLGASNDAVSEYRAAEGLLEQLIANDPAALEPRSRLALVHNNLGLVLAGRGETEAARKRYASAIALDKQLVAENPEDAPLVGQLAEAQANLGMLLDQMGEPAQAEQALRTAIAGLRPLGESMSAEPKYARDLAIACNNLSYVLRKRDVAAARLAGSEAVETLQRLCEQFPASAPFQDDLALCYNNLAAIAAGGQQLDAAIGYHEQAIALQERLVRKSPGVVRHRGDLATSLNNLGVAFCKANRAADAEEAFGRARDLLATLADDYPDHGAYRGSLAALLNNQALALAGAGRHEQAAPLYARSIELQRDAAARPGASLAARDMLSRTYYNYGRSLCASGRQTEAIDAALARRQLWADNAERLVGVAAELAEIAAQLPASANPAARQQLEDQVVSTLSMAHERGWPEKIDLRRDPRFAAVHDNASYARLLARLPADSAETEN